MSQARFANSTFFPMNLIAVSVALDATGEVEAGTANERHVLGDLARLAVTKGEARASLQLSAASAVGQATIAMKAGTATLFSQTVDLASATRFDIKGPVDLYSVGGAEEMAWYINVTTAADAGIVGSFAGGVKIEHPLIIGV